MLKTYDLIKKLTPKLGEDEAKELISFVEETRGDIATKADLQVFATKADLQAFATKTDLQNFATKADLKTEIQTLRTEMQAVKTDILKWMFTAQIGVWITIMATLLIIYFLK